jgi:serine protease Do
MRIPLYMTLLLVVLVPASTSAQATAPAAREPQARTPPISPTAPPLADLSRSLQTLTARVSPSVVQIFVTGYAAPDEEDRAASGEPQLERSSGSGVIVDAEGYIVTNAHVVENATRIEVELPFSATGGAPGRSILKRRGRTVGAQIVAVDHETDVAVVKVEARGLPALPFGDSDSLQSGQLVLAFGSPLGLESSVSMGVVSAVARQLTPEDPMIYIQTDATINPGNSGGALVDVQGRVVGINTLMLSQGGGNEGLGFAAPSNIVRTVFEQIKKWGRVKRGTIGVSAQTITTTLAEALTLPRDSGVILADVFPEQPGAAAGLRVGDIVLSLNGKPMENGRQFDVNLYRLAAGDIAALEVLRGGNRVKIPVAIAEREGDPTRFADLVTPQRHLIERLGILGLDLDASLAAAVGGVRGVGGVLVAARALNAGAEYGLEVADVILSVNGTPVKTLADLRSVIGRMPDNSSVALQIQRDGHLLFLSFEIE